MINTKNIIQQGELAKYQVIIDQSGFSMVDNDFELILMWGLRGDALVIPKADMLQNEDGGTFFTFPTDNMIGKVTVECRWWTPDSDMSSGTRLNVERQPLCFVNASAKMPIGDDCGVYNGQYVSYVRQTRGGLRSLYYYLRDLLGRPLRDVNGVSLRALKKN